MQNFLQTDAVIIGGGIAGLWLHNALTTHGYSSILVEKDKLGSGQTLASQGMIHGGIKYTLSGATTGASETIAAMPERWNQCLSGEDPIDLTGVETLARDYYMFSDASLTSKVTAFFGSKAVRGRVSALKRSDYPVAFANEAFKGNLYRLQDIVLDTSSLIDRLKAVGRIIHGDPAIEHNHGRVSKIVVNELTIDPKVCILAAGSGNGELIENLKLPVTMQLRPLHQVMVTGPDLPELYAHAVTLSAGDKPRVTFTTHPVGNQRAWYLGGQLAETGVERSEEAQIAFARKELEDLVPWVDVSECQFSTLRIDRAEAGQAEGLRPDSPYAEIFSNTIVCWPTKLTLVPMLGDKVLSMMPEPGVHESVLPSEVRAAVSGIPPWA